MQWDNCSVDTRTRMPRTSGITSMACSVDNGREFNQSGRHRRDTRGDWYTRVRYHVLPIRILIMNKLSVHFFMEVLLKKMHNTIDKYASLNQEGTAILYTTKQQPKVKQVISLAEGKRIFEDLFGAIEQRWVKSPEYIALESRKAKSQARRTNRKGSK